MTKQENIDRINDIVSNHGSFSVSDVEADSSPFLEVSGKLVCLMEDFETDGGVVRVYDPSSHSCDEIDEYFENYSEVSDSQIELILELAERWAETNEEY
jgi:hypothetical protein